MNTLEIGISSIDILKKHLEIRGVIGLSEREGSDKISGIGYIVPDIFSFTKNPFYSIPDCMFGWMNRKNPNSGEVFEPKTVQNKFNLSSESQVSIPCLIDVINNNIMWLDLSYNNFGGLRNIENTLNPISIIIKSFLSKKYMSLYRLLYIHAQARGEIVESMDGLKDEEVKKFTVDNIDWNEIMSEYFK